MINFILADISTYCRPGCVVGYNTIVCPTDTKLSGSGGADRAIHRKAGKGLDDECRKIGTINMGDAVLTGAYGLPAEHIIHTAVPRYDKDEYAEYLLAACYFNCLSLIDTDSHGSIFFPAMGTGFAGFPAEIAAKIAGNAVAEWISSKMGESSDLYLPDIAFAFTSSDIMETYKKYILIALLESMRETLSPNGWAFKCSNTLPYFFEEGGGFANLPKEKEEALQKKKDDIYLLHTAYSQYMYILYDLIGKPYYYETMNEGIKRVCKKYPNEKDRDTYYVFAAHCEEMTFEECVCYIVSLQRDDYGSGGTESTHIKHCINGDVDKVLGRMVQFLEAE